MANIQDSIKSARALLRGFKAFDEVAAALEDAATIEERIAGLKKEQAAAQKARDADVAAAEKAKSEVVGQSEYLAKLRAETDEQIKKESAEAKLKAADLVAKANAEADKIIADAKSKSEGISEKLKAKHDELAALTESVTQKKSELDELQQALDSIRAKLS